MKTSEIGIRLIKKYEGLFLTPYYCPAGYLTVGWGHLISNFETINEAKAEEYLLQDLFKVDLSIATLIKVELNQNQYDALASFTFNLGSGALQRSTLRAKINRNEDASDEFLKWININGKPSKGLLKRRIEEWRLFNL